MRYSTLVLLSVMFVSNHFAFAGPNIVFVIADDLTFRDLGCYGGQAHTPNIDRLATQGMQFSHCFQTAPMCSPTRHNIYTGLYPCLLYTSPSPRDATLSRMPSSA